MLSFVHMVTTGPIPPEGKVLEAAAIRVEDDREVDHFSALANPGSIPVAAQKLTGIEQAAVAGCASPREVVRKLMSFVSDGPAVVHDAQRFKSFLKAQAIAPPEQLLDSMSLARVVVPDAFGFSIELLAQKLELEPTPTRRALENARVTAGLWQRLLQILEQLPQPVLVELDRVATGGAHPLRDLFAETARRKATSRQGRGAPGLESVFADYTELFRTAQKHQEPEPGDEPVQTQKICEMFSQTGLVGRNLPAYEQRPEQCDMAGRVCEALNEPHHLFVEAGTGTGKSMAYLAPAIAWACSNHDKVVISTNTKNLQEQLYTKDLPFLREVFKDRFTAALLKGRRNYLCVRRFLHLVRNFARELAGPAEVRCLLPLLVWAARTETGDIAECTGFLAEEQGPGMVHWLVSGGDECAGRGCPYRTKCFVRRARTLAQLADLVVVNHSLLFSELGSEHVLPAYRCVVFDEAHNVEDAAAGALAISVDELSIFRGTNRLFRKRRDGSGSGLMATVMHEADSNLPAGSAGERAKIKDLCGKVIERLDRTVDATKGFFETLAEPFARLPVYEDRVLLRECEPPIGRDSECWQAAQALNECVTALNRRIELLAEELELVEQKLKSAPELVVDLRAQAGRLKEATDSIKFILSTEDETYVYWLERNARDFRTFYSIHAVPLDIAGCMNTYFFGEKRCIIFTSATLQVKGRFDYICERLGADRAEGDGIEFASVGSSFDFSAQSLVCVPTFLPDPGGRRDRMYDLELSSFLVELLKVTSGRALVLCTSYSLLEALYEGLKWPLEKAGLPVLAQGHGGSREAVTSLFRDVTSSVLVGTQSFWEGVDISGESLSCLVITKLPFQVFTDPVVRGRAEYLESLGQDAFQHYSLPEAVISFRQGLGRLIRSKTDRGIIVVTDLRLVTKAYGKAFLQGLPCRHQIFKTKDELLSAAKQFFKT